MTRSKIYDTGAIVCARTPVLRPKATRAICVVAQRGLFNTRAGSPRSVTCCAGKPDLGFDEKAYYRASVHQVHVKGKHGPVVTLKLMDGGNELILPVYIGEAEGTALMQEVHERPTARPLTHDLFRLMLKGVGFKVVLIRINALIGNTYHARMHLGRHDGTGVPLDIDARPSDAINMAVRFSAPLYISKEVANKMAAPSSASADPVTEQLLENQQQIVRSCKAECLKYHDPTVMYNLQLQLAIEEERYEDASMLRDKIESVMQQDQAMKLVIAIETAIEDQRFEEAARLRDELQALRAVNFPNSRENL